jgi:hypothetical protein
MSDLQNLRQTRAGYPSVAAGRAAGTPSNTQARSELARSYFGYGEMYLSVAEHADSAMEKEDNLRYARSWYQKSLDIWREIQHRRDLTPLDAQCPEQVSQKIISCDEALSKLNIPVAAVR